MIPPDVLVVDCPWKFQDKLPGPGRGAEKHYPCMSVDRLCDFPLPDIRHDAAMFFWRVASMQEEAMRIVSAWGFTVKSELVWLKETVHGKPAFGMGRYTRMAHEVCLICTRGRAMPEARNVRSHFSAKLGVHSKKPPEFYRIVETLYPSSRKFELFARVVRPGWQQQGNELGKLCDVA